MTARRLGFRGRLALSIAVTFIGLGFALVGVQYLVLTESFRSEITIGSGSSVDATGTVVDCDLPSGTVLCDSGTSTDLPIGYGQTLAADVTSRYLTWSIAVLLAFAVLAAVLAWYLTRDPARRITGISALAAEISEHDLSRRLHLTGPRDEITELADRIDTMLGRLDEAFTQQRRFAANASHELRTPITVTRTALEAPLSQGRVPPDLEPSVQRALRANERMADTVSALLMLARSGQQNPAELSDVDLAELVRIELDEWAEQIHATGLRLVADLPPPAVAVVPGHRTALAMAVRNVLGNAVRYNAPGGDLEITVTATGQWIVLSVGNSGAVYTAAEAAELVQPFNRGIDTRRAGIAGTGLGLTIAAGVTEAHQGVLRVMPREPGGLTVTLDLPAAPTPAVR